MYDLSLVILVMFVQIGIDFLEMFVEVSESAGLASSLAKACSAVGIMHNTLVSNQLIYSPSLPARTYTH